MGDLKTPQVWWETIAPEVPTYYVHEPFRPTETEADLIAAAAPRGLVYARKMFELFDTPQCMLSPEEMRELQYTEEQITYFTDYYVRNDHAGCLHATMLGPEYGGEPINTREYLDLYGWPWSSPGLWAD